jgi:hypothetical protein
VALVEKIHLRAEGGTGLFVVKLGKERILLAIENACICSARTRASVDLPTRIGPSITIYRGDLNLGPVTARDYSKVTRNARDTAARTFVNETLPRKIALQLKSSFHRCD